MSEENKAIVRRFFDEIINGRDMALAERLIAADFTDHPQQPDASPGLAGFLQFAVMVVTAFPDLYVTVEDMIAEGDKVAARVTVRGTHKGLLMGRVAPTGKAAEWTGVDIFRIAGGKIAERWTQRDLLGLMQQLGVF
ncbi:MAG: ester cyclase [Chloroflexi bacterium]|nr:ester cyclase [Chloroflexota bacterium]